MKTNVIAVLGIQGVHPSENKLAVQVGRYFSLVVNFSLVLVLISLAVSFLAPDKAHYWSWVDEFVWLVFALEFVTNLTLVNKKGRYIKNNWLNLTIVILASPLFSWEGDWVLIVRSLRLVLLIRVIFNLFDILSKILSRNSFGLFLLVSLVFLFASAFIFSQLEDVGFDDGLWYALVTITTVGYGDIVPHSVYGREFGAIMIVFGVILFSIVTANISAFLVDEEQQRTEHEILRHVRWMTDKFVEQERKNEEHLARILAHVSAKVENVENKIRSSNSELLAKDLEELKEALQAFNAEKISMETTSLEHKIERIYNETLVPIEERLARIEQQLSQKKQPRKAENETTL